MAVSVGFSSYILLSVLYFSAFAFCSEISTEAGSDGPLPVFDLFEDGEPTGCKGIPPSRRELGMRSLEHHVPAECLCEERCAFEVFHKITKRITDFLIYCYCPEGKICTKAGLVLGQSHYYYKCRSIPTTTEQKVDTTTFESVVESSPSGTERAESTVDSTATTSNAATTTDGATGVSTGTETASTETHSTTFEDRVGHFEDRSEL